jgi:hypothetical protein
MGAFLEVEVEGLHGTLASLFNQSRLSIKINDIVKHQLESHNFKQLFP